MIVMLLLASLCGCSNHDQSDINAILDARDKAVSTHDILAYHDLLITAYDDGKQNEADLVIRMNRLFNQFDRISMVSDSRIISKQDDTHVLCEQNYRLRVHADGNWRKMYQREQIGLTRTAEGWKISSGL
ncbi:MAG: hypothetical protein R8K50_09135 [Mariprofundus sp.]